MGSSLEARLLFGLPETYVKRVDLDYPDTIDFLREYFQKLERGEILDESGEVLFTNDFESRFKIDIVTHGYLYGEATYFVSIQGWEDRIKAYYGEQTLITPEMLVEQDGWVERLKRVAEFIGYPIEDFRPGWYLLAYYG